MESVDDVFQNLVESMTFDDDKYIIPTKMVKTAPMCKSPLAYGGPSWKMNGELAKCFDCEEFQPPAYRDLG
jgi:hypothetical protein